jgi:hypothetical protein
MSTKQRVTVEYSNPENDGSVVDVQDAIVQMEGGLPFPGRTKLDETRIINAVRSVILDSRGAHIISLSPGDSGEIGDVFINLREGADIVNIDDVYAQPGSIQDVVINGTDDPTTTADDKTVVFETALDGARDAHFTYNREDGSFTYTNTEGAVERLTLGDAIRNFQLTVYDTDGWVYFVEDLTREELLERARTSPTIYVRDLIRDPEVDRVRNP